MDANNIIKKIVELGHNNSQRDALQEYCKSNFDLIIKHLPRRVLYSYGADLLDCLFNGLLDTSSRDKIKIVDVVLQILRKESVSIAHCSNVINRLCLELPRLPADELLKWCNDSIQSIVDDSDINLIWRDVLPECFNALSSECSIKHCGSEMRYTEYKEQCVHTLCQCRWSERQLVQLAAVFKDLQLSKNDHKQVVNKICSYIIDIPPETLPPLVHQLIKLCKVHHLEIVLAHLSHYFNIRVYNKLEPPPQDSESTTMDIEDIVQHSPVELSRCLSTCLYHLSQGAADLELIRKHIKMWPRTQLPRAPFLIDLALAVSDKGPDFRTACLDVVRLAIEQVITDEQRRIESSWARSVLPPDVDVASLLKMLTTESANHRQLTPIGLINLAFSLLSVSKTKATAPACWSHAKLILVRMCKTQPEAAGFVLGLLHDRLVGDCAYRQFADCLHVLCRLAPHSMERSGQLTTILENCQPTATDYRTAAAALDAVHPLINFSMKIRDTLLLVCRKGLYSRNSIHRCLALSGFLTVMRNLRVSSANSTTSSQTLSSDQYSAHSYLTQLSVDLHSTHNGGRVSSQFRNEAMCLEVVSIIRRCLQQDAAVKQLLYTKIYESASEKEVLHEPILEMLYEHLVKYLPEDDGLLFDKCVQVNSFTATITEPIAHLLYTVVQFLHNKAVEDLEDILSSQIGETACVQWKSKLISILDKLCSSDRFGQIDMEEPGLADLTPESKAKCMTVQLTLQCYESLVAHQVMQWTTNSTNVANTIYNLYKTCNQLLDNAKTPQKPGKKASKSLNETKETVKSQKSQKAQKEKGKGPIKLTNLVKDRAGPFKPLPCVWNLPFCLRIIELLYSETVPWCSIEERNQLRGRRDFHQWTLRCVHSVLTADHIEKHAVASYVVKIAAVLFNRCICRFQDICDFDDQTALGCIELFKHCITLLLSTNYSLKIDALMPTITGGDLDSELSDNIATILENIHLALQRIEEDSDTDHRDAVMGKLATALAQIGTLLLETPVLPGENLNRIVVKLVEYMQKCKHAEGLSLVPALLSASCREQREAELLDALLLKLTAALGRIDEEDTSVEQGVSTFPSIDSRTGHIVLNHVCAHLTQRFRCVEHLLARGRDLATAINLATQNNVQRIDKELKELYKCVIMELCQLTGWLSCVAKLRCCVGADSDRVVGACVRLYSVLGTLLKQLQPECAHLADLRLLERLLKLSGKKLSVVTDNLITYMEASQEKQTASRVLRDTKLIPRLVLEAEQFTKHVILLADKAKINLQQYLSLGTARDFRIRTPVLQQALQEQQAENDGGDGDDDNDADTEMPTQSDIGQEDVQRPTNKRRRMS